MEGKTASKGELDHKLSHAGGTRKAKVSEADGDSNARLRFTTRAVGERFSLLEVVPEGGAFPDPEHSWVLPGIPSKAM
ncbi:MAG: hypothetical protein IPO60_05665 [Flavobacteriales bacterium]|nr:hypothetical protein [Flavobacteriales bacterium]